jgi:hypothetical protein
MNNNFNLKSFLAEGKLLKEETNPYTDVIENLFKEHEIINLETFNEELEYSDLDMSMCEEMGGDTENHNDMEKARDILKKYAADKFQYKSTGIGASDYVIRILNNFKRSKPLDLPTVLKKIESLKDYIDNEYDTQEAGAENVYVELEDLEDILKHGGDIITSINDAISNLDY